MRVNLAPTAKGVFVDRANYKSSNPWRGIQYWSFTDTFSATTGDKIVTGLKTVADAVSERDRMEQEAGIA